MKRSYRCALARNCEPTVSKPSQCREPSFDQLSSDDEILNIPIDQNQDGNRSADFKHTQSNSQALSARLSYNKLDNKASFSD